MHAAMSDEQPAGHHQNPQSLARLSPQEKLDNHQRNEEQLDKETRWDQLQAQTKGTLSFLDTERCVVALQPNCRRLGCCLFKLDER